MRAHRQGSPRSQKVPLVHVLQKTATALALLRPTAIGTAVAVGLGPLSLTIDPAGKYVYVVSVRESTS